MFILTVLLTNNGVFMICCISLADHQKLLKACVMVKVDLQSVPMY